MDIHFILQILEIFSLNLQEQAEKWSKHFIYQRQKMTLSPIQGR